MNYGVLARVARLFSNAAADAAPVTNPEQLRRALERQSQTDSGANVTADSAMRTATVYTCVRVLSEDIAALPLVLYQRKPRGKDRVTDHWLYDLLQEPNSWQTGFEFREMQQAHVELSGAFHALKTVVRGEIRELLPLPPSRCRDTLSPSWQLQHEVMLPGDTTWTPVPRERMYYVRGLTLDGVTGVSPITYQRETVGLALQMVKHGARLFTNGATVGGVLEHPQEMSDKAASRLKESFEERLSGVDNAHKLLLLEEGTKYTKIGMTGEEAQFLESRKYTRSEVAGIYRVPLHLVGDLERATNSNIEEQSRNYVQFGILPRLRRLEARALLSLVPEAERRTLFVEHLVDGLLRGSYQVRMQGYQTAVQAGWMTRNEVRELENMNPGPAQLDAFLDPAFLTGKPGGAPPDPAPADRAA
jgi:HK97 family phage portal protein